ncbi:MAG: autotransporter outer membrane beta-barrel domain-containing protein [Cyclobacteriaceae bacterium]
MLARSIIILLVGFLFSCHQSLAQESISSGKRLLGGGINFNTSDRSNNVIPGNGTDQDNLIFSFSPYVGKFVKDGTAIGFQLNTSYTNNKITYNNNGVPNRVSERKRKGIGFSFFIRKYYPINDKFGAFLNPSLGYRYGFSDEGSFNISGGSETLDWSSSAKDHTVSLGCSLGLYYFIAKKFALEANLGNVFASKTLERQKYKRESNGEITEDSYDQNNFGLNFVNQLSFDQILVITYFF